MKKLIIYLLVPVLLLSACKKSLLELPNPNQPTPDGSLVTEGGILAFADGIYYKWKSGGTYFLYTWAMESNMGDEDFSPYSNWGGRYPANINTITLPAPYNTVIPNPSGFDQLGMLRSVNSRAATDGNSIQYAWACFYGMISQANALLTAIDDPNLKLSGDANTKKKLLQGWAYFWRGYSYSRLGSLYIAGIINDNLDSAAKNLTSNVFVSHDKVIANANVNFDKAIAIFGGLSENADYDATFKAIVPNFNLNTQIITPAMWVRLMNTYKTRNFLANHKVNDMTAADWTTVSTLAASGLTKGDYSLVWGMAPGGVNDISGSTSHPIAQCTPKGSGLTYVSERLIQDIQPGDNRFTKGFTPFTGSPIVNVLSRGIQFGTRYVPVEIANGGLYGSDQHLGTTPVAPTWEENALMIAEAKIRTGSDIDGGLALIDQVRDSQGAGLAHLQGSGISQDSAISQLRSERRIGLFMRGVSWYDARRWGVTAPKAAGGGRANANVYVPGSLVGGTAAKIVPCFLDYNFVDYWDVPANETDFNPPGPGSDKTLN